MFKQPKHGWCNVHITDTTTNTTFNETASYLTDVPVDTLQLCIDYLTNGYGMAYYDCEGTEFSIIINPHSLFIIHEADEPKLLDFSNININDFIKEIFNDFNTNIDVWAKEFDQNFNNDTDKSHKIKIISQIDAMKSLMLKKHISTERT